MFGYVNINKPELKMKDFYKYKAYYCGLCRMLKKRYGQLGQMTLSYDMTFLIILLTSLYESETIHERKRCIIHPLKKHDFLRNEITGYVADMNIVLSYHHFRDDWNDEKSLPGLTGAGILKRAYKKIEKRYPRQCREINENLSMLAECEKNMENNIDTVARSFGQLMGSLFTYREDTWSDTLRKLGFFLGKFIYILDAYDDIEKDIKKGSYNPLKENYKMDTFTQDTERMLTMMMAECTKEFEKLPCLIDIDILRNILYEGVWTKFDKINNKRKNEEGQNV
jgi:hypothetical protein